MLINSSKFMEAIKTDRREMKARVTINNIVYGDEFINNIEFSSSALSGEQLTIGSTHENTVQIEFSEVINTIAPLDRVFVEIGVKRQEFSLEEKKALPAIYSALGERYRELDSWSLYMITSYDAAQQYIGRKADKNRKIYNGMMKTYFYQFMGPKPPRKKQD